MTPFRTPRRPRGHGPSHRGGTTVRCITSPNPWVGAVVRSADGPAVRGSDCRAGRTARRDASPWQPQGTWHDGATLYVTLEPCNHHGPHAALRRGHRGGRRSPGSWSAIEDPDPNVSGERDWRRSRAAGIEVEIGVQADQVRTQLAAYLAHRRTGRPWVVLKLAADPRRRDRGAERLQPVDHLGRGSRRRSSTAGRVRRHPRRAPATVRRDDPSLTVRDYRPPVVPRAEARGSPPARARGGSTGRQGAALHGAEG